MTPPDCRHYHAGFCLRKSDIPTSILCIETYTRCPYIKPEKK